MSGDWPPPGTHPDLARVAPRVADYIRATFIGTSGRVLSQEEDDLMAAVIIGSFTWMASSCNELGRQELSAFIVLMQRLGARG